MFIHKNYVCYIDCTHSSRVLACQEPGSHGRWNRTPEKTPNPLLFHDVPEDVQSARVPMPALLQSDFGQVERVGRRRRNGTCKFLKSDMNQQYTYAYII